ncbi:MAG TPA: hypothetical protein VF624_02750 [Tepidisphaeraceae bacterium]
MAKTQSKKRQKSVAPGTATSKDANEMLREASRDAKKKPSGLDVKGRVASGAEAVVSGAQKVVGGARSAAGSVGGAARSAAGSVGGAARSAAGSVGEAATQAGKLAKGHPIAATLIGVGTLAAAAVAIGGTAPLKRGAAKVAKAAKAAKVAKVAEALKSKISGKSSGTTKSKTAARGTSKTAARRARSRTR